MSKNDQALQAFLSFIADQYQCKIDEAPTNLGHITNQRQSSGLEAANDCDATFLLAALVFFVWLANMRDPEVPRPLQNERAIGSPNRRKGNGIHESHSHSKNSFPKTPESSFPKTLLSKGYREDNSVPNSEDNPKQSLMERISSPGPLHSIGTPLPPLLPSLESDHQEVHDVTISPKTRHNKHFYHEDNMISSIEEVGSGSPFIPDTISFSE